MQDGGQAQSLCGEAHSSIPGGATPPAAPDQNPLNLWKHDGTAQSQTPKGLNTAVSKLLGFVLPGARDQLFATMPFRLRGAAQLPAPLLHPPLPP